MSMYRDAKYAVEVAQIRQELAEQELIIKQAEFKKIKLIDSLASLDQDKREKEDKGEW
jgi:hypothetical protein